MVVRASWQTVGLGRSCFNLFASVCCVSSTSAWRGSTIAHHCYKGLEEPSFLRMARRRVALSLRISLWAACMVPLRFSPLELLGYLKVYLVKSTTTSFGASWGCGPSKGRLPPPRGTNLLPNIQASLRQALRALLFSSCAPTRTTPHENGRLRVQSSRGLALLASWTTFLVLHFACPHERLLPG